jgi:hypothetical protein
MRLEKVSNELLARRAGPGLVGNLFTFKANSTLKCLNYSQVSQLELLSRPWKGHLKSDLRSDQDHLPKKDLRSDQIRSRSRNIAEQ